MKIITRKQALAEGKKTYYTGKACVHGHKTWRWVSHYSCSECYKESYARMKESIMKKHGEKEGTEILRKKFRKGQQQFRDQAGDRRTEYMREYMDEYRNDPEKQEILHSAQQNYYYSDKGQETVVKYRDSEVGRAVSKRSRKKRAVKSKEEALQRRAARRAAKVEKWNQKYEDELKKILKVSKP